MKRKLLPVLLILLFVLAGCGTKPAQKATTDAPVVEVNGYYTLETLPAFSDSPFVALENNTPAFTEEEKSETSYEFYSEQDALGRCGEARACIGRDLMPTEKRGEIGQVKPTGWKTARYDEVDGKYLYNRCHLIGYQLSGENANEKNLITGTRYLNVQGMLPFENMVADYVRETGNHVLYRVTPIFEGENLLASGVEMEAESVEDGGEELSFHVYCYNVQPGIVIDYKTGDNHRETESGTEEYVLNTKSKKFHLPDCESVADIAEKNRQTYKGARNNLLAQGYEPCGRCHP